MECPVVNGKRRGGDQVAFEEKEIIETEERSYRRRITCIMSCQEVWACSQTFGGEGMLARPVPCRHGAGNSDQAKKRKIMFKSFRQLTPRCAVRVCFILDRRSPRASHVPSDLLVITKVKACSDRIGIPA